MENVSQTADALNVLAPAGEEVLLGEA